MFNNIRIYLVNNIVKSVTKIKLKTNYINSNYRTKRSSFRGKTLFTMKHSHNSSIHSIVGRSILLNKNKLIWIHKAILLSINTLINNKTIKCSNVIWAICLPMTLWIIRALVPVTQLQQTFWKTVQVERVSIDTTKLLMYIKILINFLNGHWPILLIQMEKTVKVVIIWACFLKTSVIKLFKSLKALRYCYQWNKKLFQRVHLAKCRFQLVVLNLP